MTPAIVRHYVGACDIDQASRSDYFCPTRQNPDLLNHSPRRSQRNFSLAGHAELNTKLWLLQRCTGPSHQWNLAQHLRHHKAPPLKQVAETYGPQFPCEKQIPGKRSVHRETGLKYTLVDNSGLVTH